MKRIEKFFKAGLFIAGSFFLSNVCYAQCGKFTEAPSPSDAETAHVLYRQDAKQKNFDAAYSNWQKAFKMAPAADGVRDVHYTDGINILKYKLKAETDEAKKAEYKKEIIALYDGVIACLESGAITLPKITKEERIAYHLGRKAFDQFYDLQTPYDENIKTLALAVEKGGNKTEYIVLYPYAYITVRQFIDEKITKEEARNIVTILGNIADYNISNNEDYRALYEQTKASIDGEFAQIENNIFDCDYFVEKVRPMFEDNPEDPDNLKECITILKRQGCKTGEPLLDQIEANWAKYASAVNAERQAEFEANNPAFMAKKAYDQGDYTGAIAKYREALEAETDSAKRSDYYFRIASIQGRKLNQNGQARTNALNAARENPDSGRPYMLIGDLYAKSSRSCGDDGYTRGLAVIAAIDKYQKAKAVDSSVAEEANKKIATYSRSIPTKEDVFMRGMQGGKSANVGCWIGETVKVEYQN